MGPGAGSQGPRRQGKMCGSGSMGPISSSQVPPPHLPRSLTTLDAAHGTARAAPGIEPGTSRTLSANHAARPSSQCHHAHPQVLYAVPSRRVRGGHSQWHGGIEPRGPGPETGGETTGPGRGCVARLRARAHCPACSLCHPCLPPRPSLGLLRELHPGPLAPGARIMPLDQAANDHDFETETL